MKIDYNCISLKKEFKQTSILYFPIYLVIPFLCSAIPC